MIVLLFVVIFLQWSTVSRQTVQSTGSDDAPSTREDKKMNPVLPLPQDEINESEPPVVKEPQETEKPPVDSLAPSDPPKEKPVNESQDKNTNTLWNDVRLPEWIVPKHYTLEMYEYSYFTSILNTLVNLI